MRRKSSKFRYMANFSANPKISTKMPKSDTTPIYPSVPDGVQVSMEALYSEAYALVDQGICYDEVAQHCNALQMYERGLAIIDQAGQLPAAGKNPLFGKMVKARDHIHSRLPSLRRAIAAEAASSSAGEKKKTVPDDQGEPRNSRSPSPFELMSATCDAFGQSANAEQLFEIDDGVQIFFIEEEEASVPSYPQPLRIFKFIDEGKDMVFMQVGDWVYPLVPGRSPTLHSEYGAYLFANPTTDKPDMCVGLILPADLDAATKKHFDTILNTHTMFNEQEGGMLARQLSEEERKRLSTRIAKFLVKTGQSCAWGVEKSAEYSNAYMATKAQSYKSTLDPCTQPTNIDKRVQTSVHYLRKGTKVAVKVSGYLVDAIGEAAINIGARVGKKIEKSLGGDKGGNPGGVFHSTVEVIGGGVSGVATVWMALERAARVLAKNIANETVGIVDVRYGGQAARLTDNALHAAGHGTMTAYNIHDLGPRAIAKRTAMKAGIGALRDLGGEKEPKKAIEGGETGFRGRKI